MRSELLEVFIERRGTDTKGSLKEIIKFFNSSFKSSSNSDSDKEEEGD